MESNGFLRSRHRRFPKIAPPSLHQSQSDGAVATDPIHLSPIGGRQTVGRPDQYVEIWMDLEKER